MRRHLPPGWNILWFHGSSTNTSRLLALFTPAVKACLSTRDLGVENLTPQEYSALLLTPAFWSGLPTNRVLIFQTDSGFFGHSPHRLEEFLAYEYVGAPWPAPGDIRVGNGGFSLRRRDAMVRVLTSDPPAPQAVEDVYFGSQIAQGHLLGAPLSVCFRFAVELTAEYPFPLGFHKPWDHKYRRFRRTEYNQEAWDVFARQKVFDWA